ncbi:MAG: four helix bundle protein [Ignavibacteriae bacterium]|nr:four helix bundle protein [Ignavibacteriota bacterium]
MTWNVSEIVAQYGQDIGERIFAYALRAFSLYQHVCSLNIAGAEIAAKQFLRSATSIGANYEEAQSAESRRDFIHKLRIAQKEARESRYWLRFMRGAEIVNKDRTEDIYREADEILRVLSKIIVNTEKKSG